MPQPKLDESLLLELLDHLPQSVVYYTPVLEEGSIVDFEISYCNQEAVRLTNIAAPELRGQRLLSLPTADAPTRTMVFEDLLQVYLSGQPKRSAFFNAVLQRHFDISRTKVGDGVLTLANDTTEEIRARAEKKQVARFTRSILDSSINGTFACRAIREDGRVADFEMLRINPAFTHLLKISEEDAIGKRLFTLFPAARHNGVYPLFTEVVEQGVSARKEVHYKDKNTEGWYDLSVSRLDEDTLVVNFSDVSESRQLQIELKQRIRALQRATRLSDSILDASLEAIYVAEAIREEGRVVDFRIIKSNKKWREFMGLEDNGADTTLLESTPALKGHQFFDELCAVLENEEARYSEQYYRDDNLNGWFEYAIARMDEERLVVSFRDITAQKQALSEVEKQKTLLANILEHSPSGISVTEVIRDRNGVIVDGRTILANEMSAFYSGIPNEIGLTRTIGETDPKLLSSPLYHKALETLQTGVPFRTEYFMEPTNRWLEISVARLDEEHLINLFTDISTTKVAQLQLEKLVDELKRSNASLEEFAYAASHDMQEPIRKIHFFAGRIREQYSSRLDRQGVHYFERLESAASRMRQLVEDLLAYSHVSLKPTVLEIVDLDGLVRTVLEDLELVVSEKGAQVRLETLPNLKGHKRQLQQLFQNLVSNALKYSREGVTPEIKVSGSVVNGAQSELALPGEEGTRKFHRIDVSDNGIGFSQEDAERIFQVFQRLHGNAEYKGTGVGLAIARKVAENHNGYIRAHGELGKGAVFSVYLPV